MRVIHKYALASHIEIVLPVGSIIRHVDNQHGCVTMWVEQPIPVLPTDQLEVRRFFIFGTGQEFPEDLTYIGSVLTDAGNFVWHVYEKR